MHMYILIVILLLFVTTDIHIAQGVGIGVTGNRGPYSVEDSNIVCYKSY